MATGPGYDKYEKDRQKGEVIFEVDYQWQRVMRLRKDDPPRVHLDAHNAFMICPVCGFPNTHMATVRTMWRDHEDGPGTITESSSAGINITRSDKLPKRRDRLEIDFWCERECRFTVIIEQHKGYTYIESCDHVQGEE